MIYVFLADGFEEVEAVAPTDMLRRADLDVVNIIVGGSPDDNIVESSHDMAIIADLHENIIDLNDLTELEMIVLPGGGVGVENLYRSKIVKKVITYCVNNKVPIGAICAAPSILARRGYLKDIKATAHPTFRHYLTDGGAILDETTKVITDGIFTTAAGAGVSVDFALELVRVLKGEDISKKIGEQILFY
jgi:4-methyl-5(b-hydroxyethyl)-thiazole monophosphate biosynthesis